MNPDLPYRMTNCPRTEEHKNEEQERIEALVRPYSFEGSVGTLVLTRPLMLLGSPEKKLTFAIPLMELIDITHPLSVRRRVPPLNRKFTVTGSPWPQTSIIPKKWLGMVI